MERRFWLAQPPSGGQAPLLTDEDRRHALRVLRLGRGDRCEGLDGAGAVWPLEIATASRDSLELRALGEPTRTPRPGSPGAAPWRAVWLSPPRASRLEACVERLTQLGAHEIGFLACTRTPPGAVEQAERRRAKLTRVAREALKQCGRVWEPELVQAKGLDELLAAPADGRTRIVLDPRAGSALGAWARETGLGREDGPREIAVHVGPEGGWSPEEARVLGESAAGRSSASRSAPRRLAPPASSEASAPASEPASKAQRRSKRARSSRAPRSEPPEKDAPKKRDLRRLAQRRSQPSKRTRRKSRPLSFLSASRGSAKERPRIVASRRGPLG